MGLLRCNRRTRLAVIYLCGIGIILAEAYPIDGSAKMLDLQDLTDSQRAILFQELEKYAVVTAALNYCEHPPFLERRVRAVATGCVTPKSLDTVETRFREEVTKWSGKTDCG